MTPDVEKIAPVASRPAPMEEVRPLGRDGRHCGSGFELVLDATVPQLGREVVEVQPILMTKRLFDMIGGGGQAIAQDIPEVPVLPRLVRRREPQIVVVPDLPDIPQERISERIVEQHVPVSQTIPLERISERIVERNVPGPQIIPQKRTSKRIHETVDVPLHASGEFLCSEGCSVKRGRLTLDHCGCFPRVGVG